MGVEEKERLVDELEEKLIKALNSFSMLTIEVLQTVDKNRQGDIQQMASRLCELKEYKMMKHNYEHACEVIANMHKAATGKVCGPRKGVVEDVAALRFMYIKLKEQRHDKHRNRSV